MLLKLRQLYLDAYADLPRKVWFLAIILLINRSGAMVVPFLTVYLTAEKGYSAADASWVMVGFGLGGVVGNYVGGLLNDRYGSWHIQLFSLFASGLVFILLGQIDDYLTFCGVIFLLSVTADAFRPANRAAVAAYSEPERLTQSFGLLRMAVNLGFSIGPLLGGFIIATLSYESLFWADGLTCLFSGLAFLWLLPKDETAKPPVSTTPSAPDTPLVKPSLPGLRQGWLVALVFANMLVAMCFFQLFSTAPIYLKEMEYTALQIGWIFTFSGALIVIFEMPLLHLTEGRIAPLQVLIFGSSLIAIAYFMLPLAISAGMGVLLIFVIILSFGEMLYMPFGNTYVTQNAPLARRGEYLGLLSASYSMAFVLSPVVGLNAAELIGFDFSTYLLAGLGSIGTLIIANEYRRRRSKPRVKEKFI
ncbi:MAG: MFS transporter [Bacteroidota bacterium]